MSERRETAANRRALAKAVRLEQARIRHAEHARYQAQIADIRRRRKELAARVREQCRTARARVKERARTRRAELMAELNRELREMRQAERNRCQLRRARVKLESESAVQRAKRERAETVRAERHAEQVERRRRRAQAAIRKETARAESDDEVRANLEPELEPIWERVKRRIHGRPGLSRTEAFAHWVEENPGEVWAMREELSERRLRALLREEERAARELRKARRGLGRAAIAAAAPGVPPF